MTVRTVFQLLSAIACCSLLLSCSDNEPTRSTAPEDLLVRLQALPGVEVTEISPAHDFCTRQFELLITQPVDHSNPGGQTFRQQVFLSHQNAALPMVLVPGGYSARDYDVNEITRLLGANQIYTGYRYFEGSKPEPADWTYLRVAQAAADIHEVVELLKPIYPDTWISAGVSKTGRTALIHRRFYPDDVVATVAYVAGISSQRNDPRFLDWLNSIGTEQCREDQKTFQRGVLLDRDSVETLLENWYSDHEKTISLDPGLILDWLVTEYRYSTWSDGSADCANIPDSTSSADVLFDHLISACWHAAMYSDQYLEFYHPWHYEVATEYGGLVQDVDHLLDLLEYVTGDGSDLAFLCPPGVDLTYRAEVMPDILTWLESSGNNIIYIYGGVDYVTAAAVEPAPTTNALQFIHPGGGHNTLMADLTGREEILDTLESWTGIEFPSFQ